MDGVKNEDKIESANQENPETNIHLIVSTCLSSNNTTTSLFSCLTGLLPKLAELDSSIQTNGPIVKLKNDERHE